MRSSKRSPASTPSSCPAATPATTTPATCSTSSRSRSARSTNTTRTRRCGSPRRATGANTKTPSSTSSTKASTGSTASCSARRSTAPSRSLRARVPERYPVRDYPDITHSLRCQYPVPDWDLAYALTEGREVINPRPDDMAAIARRNLPHTVGAITYCEGCNDDVNKAVWSALMWDPDADPTTVLREYARAVHRPGSGGALRPRSARGRTTRGCRRGPSAARLPRRGVLRRQGWQSSGSGLSNAGSCVALAISETVARIPVTFEECERKSWPAI